MAAVFTCTHCNAVPEQVVDGKAMIAVVRHKLGCPTLLAQTRTRWPAVDDEKGTRPVRTPAAMMAAGAGRVSTATAFEAIISAWDEQIRCEMTTKQGTRCRRAGVLARADLHGCEQALLCGHHESAWVRQATQHFRRDGAARCWWCRKRFDSLGDACTAQRGGTSEHPASAR